MALALIDAVHSVPFPLRFLPVAMTGAAFILEKAG
jgi:hypothetical protein